MLRSIILIFIFICIASCNPRLGNGLRRNDLKKDVEMITDHGRMLIHLYDSTPLHRDNFLKLVKQHYYDSILFHRVIQDFMIQAGDPQSKRARPGQMLGNGGPGYTIPAEIRTTIFHKKGVIAAARTGDDMNPAKASSGSQFYIVQGKVFTDSGLDSVEIFRLKGRKLPPSHREIYKAIGGTPHLDQNYTVFGELLEGEDVVDKIAAEPTSGREGGNRPLKDVKIIKVRLVRRK